MVKKKVLVNPPKVVALEKPSSVVELHAKEFSMDLKVQREVDMNRVEQMAAKFQPHALGIITASKRADGHIYVLDGGHRTAAARAANYDGLIATRLFTDLTLAEEAELFLTLNRSRPIMPIDRFKVRLTMEEPVAVAINTVLKRYGLHVEWANNASLGVISAIATLEKIYYGAGVRDKGEYPDLVDNVIKCLQRAYGAQADRSTYSKGVLEGVGLFIATLGHKIDWDRLNYVLEGTSPRQFVVQARTLRDAKARGGGLGKAAAEVLHQMYNHRYKDKLPDFGSIAPLHSSNYRQDPLYVDPAKYVGASLAS